MLNSTNITSSPIHFIFSHAITISLPPPKIDEDLPKTDNNQTGESNVFSTPMVNATGISSFPEIPNNQQTEETVHFPDTSQADSSFQFPDIPNPSNENKFGQFSDVNFPSIEEKQEIPKQPNTTSNPTPISNFTPKQPDVENTNDDSFEHFMELVNNPCWEYNGPSPEELFGQKDRFASADEAFTFLINQS